MSSEDVEPMGRLLILVIMLPFIIAAYIGMAYMIVAVVRAWL